MALPTGLIIHFPRPPDIPAREYTVARSGGATLVTFLPARRPRAVGFVTDRRGARVAQSSPP